MLGVLALLVLVLVLVPLMGRKAHEGTDPGSGLGLFEGLPLTRIFIWRFACGDFLAKQNLSTVLNMLSTSADRHDSECTTTVSSSAQLSSDDIISFISTGIHFFSCFSVIFLDLWKALSLSFLFCNREKNMYNNLKSNFAGIHHYISGNLQL